MSDPKLQHIEEKLAHLEMANAQLEDEVFRQQREIETLTQRASWSTRAVGANAGC